MGRDTRSRNYVLTLNYKDKKPMLDEELEKTLQNITDIRYYIFQLEQGENGTKHHQLYCAFNNKKSFTQIKEIFPTAHIQTMKGTPKQARDYCSKEETRIGNTSEWGDLPIKGKRSDLNEIMELLHDGVSTYEILRLYPTQYLRYEPSIEKAKIKIQEEKYKNEFRKLDVIYLSDIPGVGKTRYIMEKYGYENVYRVSNYKNPFDSYKGQSVIVFEEFRNSLPIDQMLNYLDGYPLTLPARYYDRVACYTKVYIVSNWTYEQQYEMIKRNYISTWKAWDRRINFKGNLNQVIEFEKPLNESKIYTKAVNLFDKELITISE